MSKTLTIPKKGAKAKTDPIPEESMPTPSKGKGKKAATEAPEKEFKYGVPDLAELMDIAPASVRVHLRANGIEKSGRSYGWDTKSELEAIAKQIRPAPRAKKTEEE